MSESDRTELHRRVIGALQGAGVANDPFPHFFATEVFPQDVYDHIQEVLACKENYKGQDGKYFGRKFSNTHELHELDFMYSLAWFKDVLMLFSPWVKEKYGGTGQQFTRDLRLIRDAQNYKIGPHTDIKTKVVSLLFYLPPDHSMERYGTAVYKPLPSFVRDETDERWGRHYPFEDFEELGRFPFQPNTCLGFWRTDSSWHGVAPIPEPVRRDVLLYNIYTPEEITMTQPGIIGNGKPHEDAVHGDGSPEHEGRD